jgi:hypothetical protein
MMYLRENVLRMGGGWNWLRIVYNDGHNDGSTWSNPITLRCNLILFSHLRLGIRGHDLFHEGFPAENLYAFAVSVVIVQVG